MDLPPHLFDQVLADISQNDILYSTDYHHVTQQAYGFYGVGETSASVLPAQHPGDTPAIAQPYASNSYDPHVALSSQGQYNSESASNNQSTLEAPPAFTASMGPPARPRKRKAPTLRADVWEPYKTRILELHVTQKLPLAEVRKMIKEERGFDAEPRQYRTRISQWKQDKKVKPQEMQAIVRKRQRRKLLEPHKRELVFEVRNSQVQPQKIERWMRRNDVAESFLYSPNSLSSTPSALGCHTISERGSPALSSIHSLAALISVPGFVNSAAQSPQMASPALSISSLVQPQSSSFTGQSPALTYRSLPIHYSSSSLYIPNMFDGQTTVVTRPRYRQDEEQRLREHISMAQVSTGTETLEIQRRLYDLGSVLLDQGRYKKAENVVRSSIAARRGSQSGDGDEDKDSLRALELLGHILSEQGLYDQAERLHRYVLRESEKVLGPEHLNTVRCVSSLASALDDLGRYEEAEVKYQQVLEKYNKELGPEHPDTLNSMNNLGVVLENLERYKEAHAMHQQALQGFTKVLGPEHPDTLSSMNNLGILLEKLERYKEAHAMHRQALQGRERVLGPEHPNTLDSMNNLGLALEKLERYEEAQAMHQQALQVTEKVLGPEHPSTLTSMNNLGLVLRKLERYGEAQAMFQQALQGQETTLGLKHPDTLRSINDLALLLDEQGKFTEAEEIWQRSQRE
ncbi:hypothetical protein M3J09_010715 [Ascochyta lentis]